jgi:hypothetical protein
MANKQSASKTPGRINAQPRLHQRTFVELITATLILAMTGVPAYSQHSHNAGQPASGGPAWSGL